MKDSDSASIEGEAQKSCQGRWWRPSSEDGNRMVCRERIPYRTSRNTGVLP